MPPTSALQAAPIWCGRAPFAYIGQRLKLSQPVQQARLQCAASGPFRLYVNGRLAGRGLGPTLTGRSMWEGFDIAALLQAGDNALVVLAAGGQDPWFRAEGAIQYRDGKRLDLASGTPWRARPARAWQTNGTYLAPDEEWHGAGDLDAGWQDADPADPAPAPGTWNPLPAQDQEIWGQLIGFGEVEAADPLQPIRDPAPLRAGKCVRREALLTPGKAQALVQTRQSDRAVYLAIDLGRIAYGIPRLRLRGLKGCVLDLGLGVRPNAVDARSRYIAADGWQEWDGLEPRCCRYLWLRVAACPQPIEVDCLSLVERVFPLEVQSRLEAPAAYSGLWTASRQALDAVRQEIYLPALDAAPGSASPERDWLRHYALALDGYYAGSDTATPAAALASAPPPTDRQRWPYLLCLEAQARHAGVDRSVQALAPAALDALDRDGAPAAAAADCALETAALEAAARLCRLLDHKPRAAAMEGRLPAAKKRLKAQLKEEGEKAALARSLALFFGLVEPEGEIDRLPARADDLLQAFFIAGALWRCGRLDRSLAALDLYWGRLAGRPGRSWTEKRPGGTGPVWPGVAYHLGAGLLGIAPAAPGYAVVGLQPPCAALEKAAGRVPTGKGHVDLRWRRAEGLELGVGLAGPAAAHLTVPRLDRRFPTIALNGDTVWRNEKVYPNPHVHQIMATPRAVVVVLHGPGEFVIEME